MAGVRRSWHLTVNRSYGEAETWDNTDWLLKLQAWIVEGLSTPSEQPYVCMYVCMYVYVRRMEQ
jgi:hypothetical protein